MINPEREITFTDSSQAPNPDIPRGRERLFKFYQDFQTSGRPDVLDDRSTGLLKNFLTPPGPTLQDLTGEAGVTSRERVRQLIGSAIKEAWKTLPPTLQNQYPLPDLTYLRRKDKWQDQEYRAKMSQAQRQRRQREKQIAST